jgi:phage tail sheath protein FI
MAKEYRTPGVYVEEISKFPPSIAAVETAIPAFIGYTEIIGKSGNEIISKPFRISSLLEYEQYFGGAFPESSAFTIKITDATDAADKLISRATEVTFDKTKLSKYNMYYALQQYFNNGGGPCYIVSAGLQTEGGTISKDTLVAKLNLLQEVDEPTLIVFPEGTNLAVGDPVGGDYYDLINNALKQCSDLGDRFTIFDVYPGTGVLRTDVQSLRDTISNDLQQIKYGASYFPFIETFLSFRVNPEHAIQHVINKTGEAAPIAGTITTMTILKTTNPQLFNQFMAEMLKQTVKLPPSSSVAGVYARIDGERGVWKAPANASLMGVKKLLTPITNDDNDFLNIDPGSGKSVNAIRFFTGKGTLVWGARTLAGNDNEWKYVSVRRFFNFAEESIKKGTERFVFEPNDANTWVKVKAMIENFLINQWRAGALAGAKAEDAFFVKVGLGQTMTAQDILDGKLIIEIGMAVVRPAEFIILRFSHKMQQS